MTGFAGILRRAGSTLLVATCAVILGALAPGPSWGLDRGRLERDLRVMEDILTSLCRHSGPAGPWPAPACRGVHVDGYGAVFLLENCPDEAWSTPPPQTEAAPTAAPEPEGVRGLLVEFLSHYAAALDQLDDGERISVIAAAGRGAPEALALAVWRLLRAPTPGDSTTTRQADRAPWASGAFAGRRLPLLSASILRGDAKEHSCGRLSAEQLLQRVRFEQQDPADPASRSVDIMAGILQRGLAHPERGVPGAAVSGAYQPGLGALFCAAVMAPAPPVSAWADRAAVVERDLVYLLARYGPALEGLRDGEQVVVEVQLPPEPDNGPAGGWQQPGGRVLARVDWRALARVAADRKGVEALGTSVTFERY